MMTRTCENCGTEFEVRTKRRTCSDSCKVQLGWKNMSAERREQRLNRMSAAATKNQSGTKLNQMRWARPGERERNAQQNRERWADPEYNTRVSAAIAAHHNSPDGLKSLSAAARVRWLDPDYRDRCISAMLVSHRSMTNRQLMSAIRTTQWRDSEYRRRGLRRLAAIRSQFSNDIIGARPLMVRPPATTQPPIRPAMPEPSRGFSMMDGRTARPERPSWRRLDLIP